MLFTLVTIPTVFAEENQTSSTKSNLPQNPFLSSLISNSPYYFSISAISSTITYVLTSRREKRRGLKSDFIDIVKLTGDEDLRSSRGVILRNRDVLKKLPKNTLLYQALTQPDKREDPNLKSDDREIIKAFEKVTMSYDRLGFMLEEDEYLSKKILDWNGHTIKRQWDILKPFVVELQTYPERKKIARYFNKIGQKAVEHEKMQK